LGFEFPKVVKPKKKLKIFSESREKKKDQFLLSLFFKNGHWVEENDESIGDSNSQLRLYHFQRSQAKKIKRETFCLSLFF